MIPESFLEQLRYACPIESVVASYVSLKRMGRDMKGLCPFHSEKTPSFIVHPVEQYYHCFGCGSGGSVITFVMNIENLEYIEAVRFLASRAGLTVPEDGVDDRMARLKAKVLEINRETARYFHTLLKSEEGRPALDYLMGRGLTPKTIKRFGLGYSPESWTSSLRDHLRRKGFYEEDMLAASVVRKNDKGLYDSFRGRVMFPIIDLRGNVIAFGGRAMGDNGPKYLNSSDTPVFKKSRGLFAMNFAKNTRADVMVLAEGYMDVIAIHQAGFDNAVATLGTALTPEQARLLGQYVKRVAIAYDSDEAGQKATARAINLFSELDISVSVLEITGAKDPDEFIKKFGKERFGNLIDGGKAAIRFELDKLKARFDTGSPEGKAEFLREFCKRMAEVQSDIQRDVYISDVARELSVGPDAIRTTIAALRKKNRLRESDKSAHNLHIYAQDKRDPRRKEPGTGLRGFVAEEKLILLLWKNPDQYDKIKAGLSALDFGSEDHRAIYEAMAAELSENRALATINLGETLGTARMARLTGLLAAGRDIPFYPGQAEEYMLAIKAEKDERTTDEVRDMSPEDFNSYITSLAAKKK